MATTRRMTDEDACKISWLRSSYALPAAALFASSAWKGKKHEDCVRCAAPLNKTTHAVDYNESTVASAAKAASASRPVVGPARCNSFTITRFPSGILFLPHGVPDGFSTRCWGAAAAEDEARKETPASTAPEFTKCFEHDHANMRKLGRPLPHLSPRKETSRRNAKLHTTHVMKAST